MTKRRADVVKNIGSGAVVLLAVFLLVLILLGNRIYVVKSGSMEPAIQTGAAAIVNQKAKYAKIQSGDIICFVSANGADVIHRVQEVKTEGIETKGDANPVPDGTLVTEENFKGKVRLAIPYAGYVLAAAASKKGRILIGTAVAVILVLSLFGEKKEEKTEARCSEKQ